MCADCGFFHAADVYSAFMPTPRHGEGPARFGTGHRIALPRARLDSDVIIALGRDHVTPVT